MKQLIGFFAGGVILVTIGVVLIPFAILWCVALLGAGGLGRVFAHGPDAGRSTTDRRVDAASIMVLNWNGRALLEQLLPSLRAAIAKHGGDHEIIVIDNGSEDDSVVFVEREFPEARIVRHPKNLKFVQGYNRAFDTATKDIVVLLNNDMVVDEGFLGPLLDGFADPDTFAVSSQIFLADPEAPRVETGLTGGAVRAGIPKFWHDELGGHVSGLIPVLWAGGGSSAFDRRRLLELGGFDPLYDPFYFEDSGLSFEAWKRGWNVLLAPDSKVTHGHQSSSRRLAASFVARIRRRNLHLFAWRQLTDAGHTVSTSLLLPVNVPRLALGSRGSSLFSRAALECGGIFSTLPRLLPVLGARLRNARHARRTDAEVFDLAHSRHRFERLRRPAEDPPASRERLDLLMLVSRVPKRGFDGSWAICEVIRQMGLRHRVTLFVVMDSDADQPHVEVLRGMVHRVETFTIDQELGTFDLHHRTPPHLRRYYSSAELRRRLHVLLRTERFDVVQVDYLEIVPLVADQLRGVRSVHSVHEPRFRNEELLQVGGVFPRIARWYRHAQAVNLEARAYARFTALSCFSSQDAEHIQAWVPDAKIRVNSVGAKVDQITPCSPSNGNTILSVAYFGHSPNVDAAIWFVTKVMPLVRTAIPDAEARLVGGGATEAIVALGERPGVSLPGRVEDLAPEMERCTLTIAPVREGGGIRTKVLESFAFGRTMVLTPVGAAGITVTDGEECRIADSSADFAAAIIDVMRDTERRHAMERAARGFVEEHYNATTMAMGYEALYREICAEDVREKEGRG